VVGYLAGPPLMKWLLVRQLSTELHRQVSIEQIDINPYALSARVAGVSVKADDGKEVAGFDELLVNLSSFSLFQLGVVVDEIRLQGPRVAVARVAEGRYDISDLLDEWMKPKEPSPTPRFSINNIQVSGGKVVFDDQPMGRVHTVSDLNFALPFISSLPYQAKIVVEPSFRRSSTGRRWRSRAGAPRSSKATWRANSTSISTASIWPDSSPTCPVRCPCA
jgi:uncharacterized protein involved in outer membrane biogenesis